LFVPTFWGKEGEGLNTLGMTKAEKDSNFPGQGLGGETVSCRGGARDHHPEIPRGGGDPYLMGGGLMPNSGWQKDFISNRKGGCERKSPLPRGGGVFCTESQKKT